MNEIHMRHYTLSAWKNEKRGEIGSRCLYFITRELTVDHNHYVHYRRPGGVEPIDMPLIFKTRREGGLRLG
jgi:hypothetical protein